MTERRWEAAVVRIDRSRDGGASWWLAGTGFMVGPTKCVTAAHVVASPDGSTDAWRATFVARCDGERDESRTCEAVWRGDAVGRGRKFDVAVMQLSKSAPPDRWSDAVDLSDTTAIKSEVELAGFPLPAFADLEAPCAADRVSELLPLSGKVGHVGVDEIRLKDVAGRPTGRGWKGLSGAGIAAHGRWTAIVTDAFLLEATWIAVTPMRHLLADESFRAATGLALPQGSAAWTLGRLDERPGVRALIDACAGVLTEHPDLHRRLLGALPASCRPASLLPTDTVRAVITAFSPSRLSRALDAIRGPANASGRAAVRAWNALAARLLPLAADPSTPGVGTGRIERLAEGVAVFSARTGRAAVADWLLARFLGRPASAGIDDILADDHGGVVSPGTARVEALRTVLLSETGLDDLLALGPLYAELTEALGTPRRLTTDGGARGYNERSNAFDGLEAEFKGQLTDPKNIDFVPYLFVRLPAPDDRSRRKVAGALERLQALLPHLPLLAFDPCGFASDEAKA